MKFIKENSYDIIRLYINQIGITIFSMALYTAVRDTSTKMTIKIIMSIFATLFYLSLIYNCVWEYGAKDRIRVDGGKAEKQSFKGLFMSLIANVPNFILSGLSIIFVSVVLLGGAEGFKTAFALTYMILRLHTAMYLGIIQGMTPNEVTETANYPDCLLESILFFLLPLLSVGVAHLAYTLGFKEIKIFSKSNKK